MGLKIKIGLAVLLLLSLVGFAQEETRVVDSLLNVLPSQQGREKVKTMIELTWEFYDVSYDDCIDWGEKAIKEAQNQGLADLEAKANYALGMQFGFNADLDLANEYLDKAYSQYLALNDEASVIKVLWKQAFLEQTLGFVDSALIKYDKVQVLAEKLNDTVNIADAYFNKGVLQWQSLNHTTAETSFLRAKQYYELIGDTVMITHADANMAVLYMENGNTIKARKLFNIVIPQLENNCDYEWLLMAYKNFGQLYVKESANYDSAYFYYDKAYRLQEMLMENGVPVPVNNRVDLLVEMGNSNYNQCDYKGAIEKFKEAYDLAEKNAYTAGKMQACVGLVTAYSYLAMPLESIHYLKLFTEMESKSGIAIARSSMRLPLMLNYARLGKFDDLESELSDFEEEYNGLLRENADIYDNLQQLRDEVSDLIVDHDSQNDQIQTLQTERNHYRLAFFGLLAIALFAVVLFAAYKIVRKKRSKV